MSDGAARETDSICSAPNGMKSKTLMKEQVQQTGPETQDERTLQLQRDSSGLVPIVFQR